MATNFPGSLDSFTNPSSSSTLDSPSHAAQHANINDAMVAVQTLLGAGSSLTWTSYTPTVAAFSGTITSYTVEYARYLRLNEMVMVDLRVSITNAGTGSAAMTFTLPVTAIASNQSVVNGREVSATGNSLSGYVYNTAQALVTTYNNGNPVVTGYSNMVLLVYKAA